MAYGAPGRTRTCGTRFRKPLLYPLSYRGGNNKHLSIAEIRNQLWWRWGDSNPRPLHCERSALPAELHPHIMGKPTLHKDELYTAEVVIGFAAKTVPVSSPSPKPIRQMEASRNPQAEGDLTANLFSRELVRLCSRRGSISQETL